ncbi:UPF0454 protein C12orf49 homolog [Lingula anatina]|uniref:SREBP regulating gene protein n=1 Tax=Lingula anatina TaxID=7574 RepID=A0A1S3I5M2_LINAN|nr:UPF0454 protein C12orf49 homolog [Lingula anatina]XP_013392669.1 UPF0454 protein C12orf49 homolog [Lingula anatina]|eukprot:XP_013387840.1 UPF0454 protein C12orf49 homolog [Lingula anatina]
MFNSRTFRRRWFLAVVFGLSVLYFLANIYKQHPKDFSTQEEYRLRKPLRVAPEQFKWQPKFESANASKIKTCRNSVQGKLLVADDRGYVCDRSDLLPGSCCDTLSRSTKHYTCETCTEGGCCALYEYCVSCCLHPEKQQLLRKILSEAVDSSFSQIYASITDHFELCLTKCRTNSQSVQHENSYRDPKNKHCYGDKQPVLQPAIAKK